jgi:hypothetical protein
MALELQQEVLVFHCNSSWIYLHASRCSASPCVVRHEFVQVFTDLVLGWGFGVLYLIWTKDCSGCPQSGFGLLCPHPRQADFWALFRMLSPPN